MQAPREITTGYALQPRLRVFGGRKLVLGWGKIMLLELIQETGSIAEAAQRMEISYNHAWTLLRTMNASFRQPLVTTMRGGRSKGGAFLTETGQQVIDLYNGMIAQSRQATEGLWNELHELLLPVDELPARRERDVDP